MPRSKLSEQVERKAAAEQASKQIEYEGSGPVISTGSTLLDLAISGGRFRGGGIPTGIFVEVFGPSGSGKTVLLAQIAANVQRMGGKVLFHDPEARLNKEFATIFGMVPDDIEYSQPDTISQMFSSVRNFLRQAPADSVCGVFADSLAALSTELEMSAEEGDKMGMRRAREFSEQLRRTCRLIAQRKALMVCSNQVRQNLDSGPYGMKYVSPGGEAIGFYSSLRLRCTGVEKLKVKKVVSGKEHQRVVGIKSTIEVFKSTVWKPYSTADVYIIYDYGIDDITANLKFLKENTNDTVYSLNGKKLGRSLEEAIRTVEDEGLERELKEAVIDLWTEIEETFQSRRKPRTFV